MTTIVMGTRNSPLALAQTQHVATLLQTNDATLKVTQKSMVTLGDKRLDVALGKIGDKGLFVKELETALMAGDIDVAIHSYKDMPTTGPEGLTVVPVGLRDDYRDALVCQESVLPAGQRTIATLPQGVRVGTSSVRRENRLNQLRPDITVVPIRGNVNTRLRKLAAGEADALLLASAGLARLGLSHHVHQYLGIEEDWLPAPAQGILAAQYRADNTAMAKRVAAIQHRPTVIQAQAERGVLETMDSGCHIPLAVMATINGEQVTIVAQHIHPEAGKNHTVSTVAPVALVYHHGRQLGEQLKGLIC